MNTFNANFRNAVAACAPEPETCALMLAGLAVVGAATRRRSLHIPTQPGKMGKFPKTGLRGLLLLCGVAFSCAAVSQPVLTEEAALVPSQIPYYDQTKERSRADINSYAAAKGPKALAINPNGQTYWWGPVESQAEASRRALENCEFSNKSPCVLGAVGDLVQKWDVAIKPVSVFAALGNEIDPRKTPFLREGARKQFATTLAGARKNTRQYTAVALHPRGGWFVSVDPSYTSQADADNAALAACVKWPPPNKFWSRGSCFLFSQGTQIVGNFPTNVTYASVALVLAASDSSAVVQNAGGPGVVEKRSASPDAEVKKLAQAISPDRIHFVHTGGNDCPPCAAWRGLELPKLQKLPAFQAIKFSFVVKTIGSPFPPSESFLPVELKPMRAKLEQASGGRAGSPQQLLMVDGEVYDYWVGALDAAEIEARIAAITSGTRYPAVRCIRAYTTRGGLQCAQYAG